MHTMQFEIWGFYFYCVLYFYISKKNYNNHILYRQ